jgi:hypothetical protein
MMDKSLPTAALSSLRKKVNRARWSKRIRNLPGKMLVAKPYFTVIVFGKFPRKLNRSFKGDNGLQMKYLNG